MKAITTSKQAIYSTEVLFFNAVTNLVPSCREFKNSVSVEKYRAISVLATHEQPLPLRYL
jgi:hypothetical protein